MRHVAVYRGPMSGTCCCLLFTEGQRVRHVVVYCLQRANEGELEAELVAELLSGH